MTEFFCCWSSAIVLGFSLGNDKPINHSKLDVEPNPNHPYIRVMHLSYAKWVLIRAHGTDIQSGHLTDLDDTTAIMPYKGGN